MTDFFFNTITISLLTYISLCLTLYYSLTIRHKKLTSMLWVKGDTFVLALWNACYMPIFKEEVQYLYVDTKSLPKISCFSTDPDVQLVLKTETVLMNQKADNDDLLNRIHLSFDYLCPRNGFIIEFKEMPIDLFDISVYGRLRGEKKKVIYSNGLDLLTKASTFFIFIIAIVYKVLELIHYNQFNVADPFFYIVTFILGSIAIFSSYYNSLPLSIREKITKYEAEGFHRLIINQN